MLREIHQNTSKLDIGPTLTAELYLIHSGSLGGEVIHTAELSFDKDVSRFEGHEWKTYAYGDLIPGGSLCAFLTLDNQ